MTAQHKRMRTSSGGLGNMSTASSNTIVKREEEVQQRVVLQPGSQGGAAAASPAKPARDQATSMRGDDSSKLIQVSMEDRWLHCKACSGALKLPVYKCDAARHKVCCTCRGEDNSRCRACNGAATSFTLCSDEYQELVRAPTVACPYQAYGCRWKVSYITADEHRRECQDKPCSCSEKTAGCDGGFLGSPRTLHEHLAGPLHSWPTGKIEYGKPQMVDIQRRRLLVSEGEGRVFVLAVAEDAAAGMTNVSLMCLRSNAAAAGGPHYKAVLWSNAPRDLVTGVEERHDVLIAVQSRESPCEIGIREGTVLPLQPRFRCGASRKIVLHVRIDKLKPIPPQH